MRDQQGHNIEETTFPSDDITLLLGSSNYVFSLFQALPSSQKAKKFETPFFGCSLFAPLLALLFLLFLFQKVLKNVLGAAKGVFTTKLASEHTSSAFSMCCTKVLSFT